MRIKIEMHGDSSDINAVAVVKNIKIYMDSLAVNDAEDSSYDSECDGDISHEQVSRTTSDTLGEEFAEYVSQPQTVPQIVTATATATNVTKKPDPSPSYTQRVEFALKLGYTERLVQAALARLGADPAQNELLAELIKLGAQHGNKNELGGDSSLSNGIDSTSVNNINNVNNGKDDGGADSRSSSLRPIVIDGSNLAFCHGNKESFSCLGIRLCVDWFRNRGHKDITVFVPKFRKENPRPDNPIKDQDILFDLEKERMLVYTPSRFVGGKRTVCYDDRYILKLAVENDGIVVSNDNYRDLANESIDFKKVVEERVLMYSFVADRFMPPDDPLGRSGPTLDNFLRMQPKKSDPSPQCPYGKKCTYGNKCKFYHPERGIGPHKSVIERLSEHAARHLSARNSNGCSKAACGKSLSVPLSTNSTDLNGDRRKPLARTRSCAHDGCNSSSCYEMMHRQRLQSKPSYVNQMNSDDQNHSMDSNFTNAFAESCRLENMKTDLHQTQTQSSNHSHNSHQNLYRIGPSLQHQQQQQQQSARHLPPYGNVMPNNGVPGHMDNREDVNLHQKLRRQLSLNPSACDPRLIRMQNQNQIVQHPHPDLIQHQNQASHRQLAPSLSGPRSHITNNWDLHQNVTRIASAPNPANRTWQNGGKSQIGNDILTPWSQQQNTINVPQSSPQPPTTASSPQNHRQYIQYHLSSIFPEEQVLTVMSMYPEETNPQNICAAILRMFPKI